MRKFKKPSGITVFFFAVISMFLFTICSMTVAVSTVQADLLVGTDGPPDFGAVRRFDNNGVFLGNFTSGGPQLDGPAAVHFGPDGNVYVLSGSDRVFRYDGITGVFIDEFIPAGTAGLAEAQDMIFGPDGNMYISANEGGPVGEGGRVMRFHGLTGSYMGDFIPNGAGQGPTDNTDTVCEAMKMAFGPDGFFYLGNDPRDCACQGTSCYNVMRFNATTGQYVDTPFPAGFLGLYDPNGLTIGPDCNLYISSEGLGFEEDTVNANPNVIYRLILTDGSDDIEEFVPSNGLLDDNGPFPPGTGLIEPEKIVFGPDFNLYVTSGDTSEIYVYNGTTGALINFFSSVESDPKGITFFPGESPQCVVELAKIPTLNEWGLISMAVLLGIIALFALRRKKAVV